MKKLCKLLPFVFSTVFFACGEESATSVGDESSSSYVELSAISSSSNNERVPQSGQTDEGLSSSSSNQEVLLSSSSISAETESSSAALSSNYDPVTGILTDERDGRIYKTAKVGKQIWMAQNLWLDNPNIVDGCTDNYYDYQIENDSILEKHGRHYGWITAVQISCEYEEQYAFYGTNPAFKTPVQGICPSGWHIPTIAEWQELFNVAPLEQLLSKEYNRKLCKGTDNFGLNLTVPNDDEEYYTQYIVVDEASPTKAFSISITCDDPDELVEVVAERKYSIFTYLRCVKD